MTINGTPISVYGAQQWSIIQGHCAFSGQSEWQENLNLPHLTPSNIGLKKYNVVLMIRGRNRNDIYVKASRLIGLLTKPSEIVFDGVDSAFSCVLTNVEHKEPSINRFHTLQLELTGYEYSQHGWREYMVTPGDPIKSTVNNDSGVDAPVLIELSGTYVTTKDTIICIKGVIQDEKTGEDQDIIISMLKNFFPYDHVYKFTIDGRTGVVKRENINTGTIAPGFDIVDIHGVPQIRQGTSIISITSSTAVAVNFTYKLLLL